MLFHPLSTIILLASVVCFRQPNVQATQLKDEPIIVTLLGTGGPQPLMDRFGPSILVQAGGKKLLFDAGRGCLQRLRQINIANKDIEALFLTHLHSDHIVGLPDFWLVGWAITRRDVPLKVFGPKGSAEMTNYLQKAYAFDIKMRVEANNVPANGHKLITSDIGEGVIYDEHDLKVTAFLVDHHPIAPAFGYKIEYNRRSVVLSGDTRYSENLIRFAKGADLLIHEVALAPDTLSKNNRVNAVLTHHISPEQAGKLFTQVKPKLAVYSHIVKFLGATDADLRRRTETTYLQSFTIGEDLMTFHVDEDVSIRYWK
jgi:ribonuclease Z